MFADTPWTISPPAWIADYPSQYSDYWPGQKRQTRLHAMGYDAYHLAGTLYGSREQPMEEMIGATGRLYLDETGQVHRKLAWARFENGVPVALQETEEFDSPMDDTELNPAPEQPQTWREMPLER